MDTHECSETGHDHRLHLSGDPLARILDEGYVGSHGIDGPQRHVTRLRRVRIRVHVFRDDLRCLCYFGWRRAVEKRDCGRPEASDICMGVLLDGG